MMLIRSCRCSVRYKHWCLLSIRDGGMAICFPVCRNFQVSPVQLAWLRQHCDILAPFPALGHACASVKGNHNEDGMAAAVL